MSDLTGQKLYPVVWEVIEALELDGLPVVSVISDGAGQNRRFYKLCKTAKEELVHKTLNPFDREHFIYFFCDLIKTARNFLSNSNAHSLSRQMQVKNKLASDDSVFVVYVFRICFCRRMGSKFHGNIWNTSF